MTYLTSGFARSALLALVLGLSACSDFGTSKDDAMLSGATLPPADVLYQQGITDVQAEEYDRAVKIFNAVEENYPYSTWSTHAQLMHGYAQYKQQNYDEAIDALERFIALHPENQDAAYAYYLKALCYYEQIDDVERDQTATFETIQAMDDVITRFPDTAYARDARIKLRLAYNRLAGQEMSIGRYYEKQHLYAAAIGRFQDVVQTYQTTTYVPEALERLTEIYLNLGLTDAAQQTASVLAYNYPGSVWYHRAYSKLHAHDLVADAGPAAPADGGQTASPEPATPPPKHHGFFFGLF